MNVCNLCAHRHHFSRFLRPGLKKNWILKINKFTKISLIFHFHLHNFVPLLHAKTRKNSGRFTKSIFPVVFVKCCARLRACISVCECVYTVHVNFHLKTESFCFGLIDINRREYRLWNNVHGTQHKFESNGLRWWHMVKSPRAVVVTFYLVDIARALHSDTLRILQNRTSS